MSAAPEGACHVVPLSTGSPARTGPAALSPLNAAMQVAASSVAVSKCIAVTPCGTYPRPFAVES